ncbi:hypothetical protein [Microlunatus sp. Y2014]|uniref:hypothetical protein n=1 Tax=Microlunatus sp. Y2014 TaxID=3418488 RepID=UPI003DA73813
MSDVRVRPEEITRAARAVEEAGNQFGRDAESLGNETSSADLFGRDELGVALVEMHNVAIPEAIDYYGATGNCVTETATGMDRLARAYMAVEEDNSAEVVGIFLDLGIV